MATQNPQAPIQVNIGVTEFVQNNPDLATLSNDQAAQTQVVNAFLSRNVDANPQLSALDDLAKNEIRSKVTERLAQGFGWQARNQGLAESLAVGTANNQNFIQNITQGIGREVGDFAGSFANEASFNTLDFPTRQSAASGLGGFAGALVPVLGASLVNPALGVAVAGGQGFGREIDRQQDLGLPSNLPAAFASGGIEGTLQAIPGSSIVGRPLRQAAFGALRELGIGGGATGLNSAAIQALTNQGQVDWNRVAVDALAGAGAQLGGNIGVGAIANRAARAMPKPQTQAAGIPVQRQLPKPVKGNVRFIRKLPRDPYGVGQRFVDVNEDQLLRAFELDNTRFIDSKLNEMNKILIEKRATSEILEAAQAVRTKAKALKEQIASRRRNERMRAKEQRRAEQARIQEQRRQQNLETFKEKEQLKAKLQQETAVTKEQAKAETATKTAKAKAELETVKAEAKKDVIETRTKAQERVQEARAKAYQKKVEASQKEIRVSEELADKIQPTRKKKATAAQVKKVAERYEALNELVLEANSVKEVNKLAHRYFDEEFDILPAKLKTDAENTIQVASARAERYEFIEKAIQDNKLLNLDIDAEIVGETRGKALSIRETELPFELGRNKKLEPFVRTVDSNGQMRTRKLFDGFSDEASKIKRYEVAIAKKSDFPYEVKTNDDGRFVVIDKKTGKEVPQVRTEALKTSEKKASIDAYKKALQTVQDAESGKITYDEFEKRMKQAFSESPEQAEQALNKLSAKGRRAVYKKAKNEDC